MNSQDTNLNESKKSSAELQREVHGQIDKIGQNIDSAQSRMTPGALIDDAIFYPHGKSLKSTYTHLKNNPMGTMFLSLGTLLLMEDQNQVTYEAHLRSSVSEAAEKGSQKYSEIKENMGQKAHELTDEVMAKKDEFQRELSQKKDSLKAKYQDTKSSISQEKERIKEDFIAGARDLEQDRDAELRSYSYALSSDGSSKNAKEKGAQKLDNAKEAISDAYENAKSSIEEKVERVSPIGQSLHPFAIASIGLGLGSTLGASLPSKKLNSLTQDPQAQEKLQRLNKDFDHAIRESGERLKGRLIDELKNISFH